MDFLKLAAPIKQKVFKVTYEQHKEGRRIVGFTFKFKVKTKKALESKRDADTPDMLTSLKMTDKQRSTFAAKLARMSELSESEMIKRLKKDASQFKKRPIRKYLDY